MDSLDLDDVASLLRLVAEAGDPTVQLPIPERKRRLISGLAEVVEADVWIWCTGVTELSDSSGDIANATVIDGGWENDEERRQFHLLNTNVELYDLLQGGCMLRHRQCNGRPFTLGKNEVVDPARRAEAFQKWDPTGLGDALVAVYPLKSGAYSAFGLHRRRHRPMFGERERAIVQLVLEQVDWLHQEGTNVAAGEKVLQLSGRQRQVLFFLLGGDTQRQVALKLHLSEHTVGDYVKEIYRRFNVNSRGELFAHFVSGGAN